MGTRRKGPSGKHDRNNREHFRRIVRLAAGTVADGRDDDGERGQRRGREHRQRVGDGRRRLFEVSAHAGAHPADHRPHLTCADLCPVHNHHIRRNMKNASITPCPGVLPTVRISPLPPVAESREPPCSIEDNGVFLYPGHVPACAHARQNPNNPPAFQ